MVIDEATDYFRHPLLKRAHDIYSLFFVGAMIGWLTIPLGSVLALLALPRAKGSPLASHFRFQACSALWMVVLLALGLCLFKGLRLFADVHFCPAGQIFMPPRWSTLFIIFYSIALYGLWIIRFWRGYQLLSRGAGISHPFTPLLPREWVKAQSI